MLWYKTSEKHWLSENAIFGILLVSHTLIQRRQIKHSLQVTNSHNMPAG